MTEYVKCLTKILQAAKPIEGPRSSISVWPLCTSSILGKVFSVSLVERSIPGAAGHQDVVKVEGKSAGPGWPPVARWSQRGHNMVSIFPPVGLLSASLGTISPRLGATTKTQGEKYSLPRDKV